MPDYRTITSPGDAQTLADLLNGSARSRPVVVVTTPHGRDNPWIDVGEIVSQVGDLAEIYVMTTGPHSWEFSNNVPAMTQVYGGAGRVYPLGHQWASEPRRSPLRFAYNAEDGQRATAQLIDDALRMATEAGLFDRKVTRGRARRTGTVHGIVAERALVKLDGLMGVVPDALAFPGVPIDRCVAPGQELTGLYDGDSHWFDVRESRLEPEVALTTYAAGDVILAQVEAVQTDHATVFLHPLVTVRLDRREVTSNELDDLRDLMTPDEILVVRVVAPGPHWRLSMWDLDDEEEPVRAAALFPGGPPWLLPAADAVDDLGFTEPAAVDVGEVVEVARFEQPPEPELSTGPAEPRRPSPAMLDARRRTPPSAPAPSAPVAHPPGGTHQMSLTIAGLQAEIKQLRRQTETLASQVQSLGAELTHERSARHRAESMAKHLEKQLEHSRAKFRRTRATSPETARPRFADRERGFRFLVEQAWATRIPLSEQSDCPLPRYAVGPELLDSVEALDGITSDKIADVVMEVLTGKAQHSAGRQLHPLRIDEGGGSPQTARADGAKAWRVNLQTHTPSARRLHYWVLTDGTIELAKVGLHDDTAI